MADVGARAEVDYSYPFGVVLGTGRYNDSGSIVSDQSLVVTEVIVPFIEHDPQEVFRLRIGDKYALQLPLTLLTDSYRAALAGRPGIGRSEEEGIEYALSRSLISLESHSGTSYDCSDEVISCGARLATAIRELRSLGLVLALPLIVPPRQLLEVSTDGESQPRVWLRGLLSRDVA